MSTVLRDGIVKTRKPHECHGCEEIIPAGTKVYSQTNVLDGIFTLYMCDNCIKFCASLNCIQCLEMGEAQEGYVRECRLDNFNAGG